MKLVVLKQFVAGLPEATTRWVCFHRPADLTAVPHCQGPSTYPRSGKDTPNYGKVSRGYPYALVDTGCTQTLVYQSLFRPKALLDAEWVEVKCVHGDVRKYPVVSLLLIFKGKNIE